MLINVIFNKYICMSFYKLFYSIYLCLEKNTKIMKKYKFTQIERFVIWKAYNYLCFYCGRNLKWKDLSIDHLFPECLLHNHNGFLTIKKVYSLQSDFCINDFVNWVPAHGVCNNEKGDFIPHLSTNFDAVNIHSNIARRMYNKLLNQRTEDEALEKLLSNLENGTITTSGLYKLMEKTTNLYFGFPEIEPENIINVPDNWTVLRINKFRKFLLVTDGKRFGKVPSAFSPDAAWLCPSCNHYGPWNRRKCLICGYSKK